MVAPRTVMTCDKLGQLIDENFTLYSRSYEPFIDFEMMHFPLEWSYERIASYTKEFNVFVKSEVADFQHVYKKLDTFIMRPKCIKSLNWNYKI